MTDVDKPAFLQAFSRLAVALQKDPDVITMRLYFDTLQDVEIEFLTVAAERLMSTAEWFPKVSEWRAAACQVAAERFEAQQAYLRTLPAPLCEVCADTGWTIQENRASRCPCVEQRRRELLGRVEDRGADVRQSEGRALPARPSR